MTEPRKNAKILFVCTGNTCRSPMAELLFNSVAPTGVRAESAGLAAFPGVPMSAAARQVLAERNISECGFRSRPLTAPLAAAATRIVGMTAAHCREIVSRFPDCAAKTVILLPDGGDVPDPFGGDAAAYRRCLERMLPAVRKLAAEFECEQ